MKSLLYLGRKTAKNRILQLRRRPAQLIAYLLLAAMMVFSFATAGENAGVAFTANTDIGWLKLIFLAYTIMFAITSLSAGLSTGASVFDMPDVNFLFVSPVNPKQILVYGLLRQAMKSLMASVFILFTGSALRNIWGITLPQLLCLFLGYVLALVIFQLLSVVIYMRANSRPHIKRWVVIVSALSLVPTVAAAAIPYLQGVPAATAILHAVNGPVLFTVPIAGWITEGAFALLGGNALWAVFALALVAAAVFVMVLLITTGKTDYYEDVLVATETTFQRKQAVLAGDLQAGESKRKVRLGKTVRPLWGHGAAVFLGKHLREDFRKNRLKLLDATSFSFILTAVIMAFFMRDSDAFVTILITTMFMRAFFVGTGLGLRELFSHYIYMVPASSFSKIVFSNLEVCIKSLAENLLGFGIAGIIMRAPVGEVLACVVVSTVYAALLVSVNLLSMRIFRNVISQGLLLTFYIMFIVLSMAPGIVGAVVVGFATGSMALALLALTLWEVLLSALFFFLSRGVLHNSDMETMPSTVKNAK